MFPLYIFVIILIILLAVVFLFPSPIDATAWTPPPTPAWDGALTPNNELSNAELLGQGQLRHPEDIAFDQVGRLYTGCEDGKIYRIHLDASGGALKIETFIETGGYPLGLHFDRDGNLIAAVKGIGLLRILPSGQSTILTNEVDGTPITYANDLDIAQDGTIYFSDSSTKFTRGWPYDILEAHPYGRLLAYDPATKKTSLIKDGLYFANGVLLAEDESYILVCETERSRVRRYWLKGEKTGTWDFFANNLPIMADNIDRDDQGNYFVAGNRRLPFLNTLHPNPFLKNQIAKIPFNILRDFPDWKRNRYGLVLKLDQNGNIKKSLHDPSGRVYATSSANPHGGYLFIGSLYGHGVARYLMK